MGDALFVAVLCDFLSSSVSTAKTATAAADITYVDKFSGIGDGQLLRDLLLDLLLDLARRVAQRWGRQPWSRIRLGAARRAKDRRESRHFILIFFFVFFLVYFSYWRFKPGWRRSRQNGWQRNVSFVKNSCSLFAGRVVMRITLRYSIFALGSGSCPAVNRALTTSWALVLSVECRDRIHWVNYLLPLERSDHKTAWLQRRRDRRSCATSPDSVRAPRSYGPH